MLDKELGQAVEYIVRVQPAIHDDCHAPSGELIDHSEHTELPSVVCSIHDEVIGPDMIGPAWPQTDAGSVVEPQPVSLRLLLGDLQPLPSPDTLDPLGVHMPSFGPEHGSNPPIAISAVLAGQTDDCGRQGLFIMSATRTLALGRAVLTDNSARSPLRDAQRSLQMVNALPATGGA